MFSRGSGWLALTSVGRRWRERHLRSLIQRPACNQELINKSVREAWFSAHPRRFQLDYFVESSGVFFLLLLFQAHKMTRCLNKILENG